MKKLYKKGKIHPSPTAISDHLSLLPAAVLTLTVALSPQDREVLAYLISCSGNFNNYSGQQKTNPKNSGGDHPPKFHCNCFGCYMSYWVRWDNSPNRQLIHEIIDAYEDGLFRKKINTKGKKEKRKRVIGSDAKKRGSTELESVELSSLDDGEDRHGEGEVGSVKKLVSFIGERIWGVWGV